VSSDLAAYVEALRQAFVVLDAEKRKTVIAAEIARIEKETGCRVRRDDDLLDEVSYLVEYPVSICGEFDTAFLEVPEEVVVSAMRSRQRYFAMEDDSGALANRFLTVAGTVTSDMDVVKAGNERVLAARLADAKFFFSEDQKVDLAGWAEKLSGVVFQKKLGTIADKVARFSGTVAALADDLGVDKQRALEAAGLAKADLVTHMVGEFPELQGTMGRRYAEIAGVDAEVAAAVEEHYLPRGANDSLPPSDLGALVGIADRIDTIVGCFAAGLAPTGSADPYGLRRAAVAILVILLDRNWSVSVADLIARAASEVDRTIPVTDEVKGQVAEFFTIRLRGLMSQGEEELPQDCVEAALAAGANDVPDARRRAQAVANLRARADFEPLAATFKRVANILKGEAAANEPDPEVFVEDDERKLWQSFGEIEGRVRNHLETGDYQSALQVLVELKAPVDRFFDSVLVMDKDEKVRENRLALLGRINATFTRIADFRQLAV
jgi:glycyl-tRNA synthetase beta chain